MKNPDKKLRHEDDLDLDAIVTQFRPIIGFKVRHALGWRNQDWEDVTNEVLTQVIAKIRSNEFRRESKIGTFIYTIACRRIIDYIREKSKVHHHPPAESDSSNTQSRLEEEKRIADLTTAVRKLPQKYREVLDLYYYQEMSREETARRIGITPAKVSERVHYAQKLLRKNLQQAGIQFLTPPLD